MGLWIWHLSTHNCVIIIVLSCTQSLTAIAWHCNTPCDTTEHSMAQQYLRMHSMTSLRDAPNAVQSTALIRHFSPAEISTFYPNKGGLWLNWQDALIMTLHTKLTTNAV